MSAFIKALENNGKMPVDGNDGFISLAIGMAAKKSIEDNRPVKIEEIILQSGP
jgi:myo-inositol 2-dehydrogenase/D-chiro-inositol 1-dehydrogenase